MPEPEHRPRYDSLIAACGAYAPTSVAVVHPCDRPAPSRPLSRPRGAAIPSQRQRAARP